MTHELVRMVEDSPTCLLFLKEADHLGLQRIINGVRPYRNQGLDQRHRAADLLGHHQGALRRRHPFAPLALSLNPDYSFIHGSFPVVWGDGLSHDHCTTPGRFVNVQLSLAHPHLCVRQRLESQL